ncbi:phosphoribosylformylglycinamidine cyclo-ligase [Candidatus Micrarchaeota archaeon]|nr:phosphoribosylformylglycinamidine cyclo-ligase [Candidatus Micrarchaeota archaeon]
MSMDYAKAGVDVNRVKGIHASIDELISTTQGKDVLPVHGHYAGIVKVGKETIAIHTDGVGSKVLVAQFLKKYDTVGIDCIAMNVNDVICVGAKPVALVDYIALEHEDEELVSKLMQGLVEGAKEAEVAIVGGETAILPDMIRPGLDFSGFCTNGFDLAATCVGVVGRWGLVAGEKIKTNDAVIGVESSGLHSNGYTLARKVLDMNEWARELLTPTRIYAKPVMECLKKFKVHGLAHITGGAFSKLSRIGTLAKRGFLLDNMPKPKPIFEELKKKAGLNYREMYSTFNMGVGLCIVTSKGDARKIIDIFEGHGQKCHIVGKVIKENKVEVLKDGTSFVL